MTRKELVDQIFAKKTYLCVGLDTDLSLIPPFLHSFPDPVFEFNRRIIDATSAHCVSYKLNTAFYEANGAAGWHSLQRTAEYISSTHFKIADAKRGDIGNTSAQYARAFFETMGFDVVTVAPYMGEDSVRPFLQYPGKWTILLGLTSNAGAADFEMQKNAEGYLYETVIRKAAAWGSINNLMFVIGATRPEWLASIHKFTPDHFYLVPGVGAQGGSLQDVSDQGMNAACGLLVNASRAIIYASAGEDFAEKAAVVAAGYQQEMRQNLLRIS